MGTQRMICINRNRERGYPDQFRLPSLPLITPFLHPTPSFPLSHPIPILPLLTPVPQLSPFPPLPLQTVSPFLLPVSAVPQQSPSPHLQFTLQAADAYVEAVVLLLDGVQFPLVLLDVLLLRGFKLQRRTQGIVLSSLLRLITSLGYPVLWTKLFS